MRSVSFDLRIEMKKPAIRRAKVTFKQGLHTNKKRGFPSPKRGRHSLNQAGAGILLAFFFLI
jgi:hypothetical protein